ncbi:HAD family hydrolase [Tianweitania populi]|uniref:Phosphoglycolate phosphatase n=1 Tax=Tianweitania populi TaxID=1607949 RepID=A0A8J3DPQ9_9HYPH|nr:HAD family hydrolase [Tianweitania populi]GHD10152.1 phosphoglycolate phosphatase [Tianweitania populi]
MTQPIIVFDLDGTLVDTGPDLLAALSHSLKDSGLPPIDPNLFQAYLGMGGRAMIERAFRQANRTLDDEQHEKLIATFLQHYTDNIPGTSQLFPGARDAMQRFADAGWTLAICTNKFEKLSHALIEGLGIHAHFAANCGADTFAWRKPDPRHLISTIEQAGGDPDQAVMVGDSKTDIDTAKAAGIPVVAVDFGYTDQPVATYEPSMVISHYDELTVAVATRLIAAANEGTTTQAEAP